MVMVDTVYDIMCQLFGRKRVRDWVNNGGKDHEVSVLYRYVVDTLREEYGEKGITWDKVPVVHYEFT